MICPFCNSCAHAEHSAREMMFGLRERFTYLECHGCGVLTLANAPRDLSSYYPDDYYSFSRNNGLAAKLKPFLLSLNRVGVTVPLSTNRLIDKLKLTPGMRILDVGGGNGQLVKELRTAGFHRAICIDPFASQETAYCRKVTLSEMPGEWDCIMFHHSFEHIEDQLGTLAEVRRKISHGGVCLIRVPVARWAWRHYGVNWVQLDAPRHMCIHTPTSMERAAKLAELELVSVESDSWAFQFWGSELYRKDVPLSEGRRNLSRYFDAATMKKFEDDSRSLNDSGQGDQASFILTLSELPRRPLTMELPDLY